MSSRVADREVLPEQNEPVSPGASGEGLTLSSGSGAFQDDSLEGLLRELASGTDRAGPPLPQTGDVIGEKYRVEEELGRGGMGTVFRATHLVSGKQVAVKWMRSSGSNDNARSRAVREARAAARIDHPNVVDIYDIGQTSSGVLFLVMQLLRGESLAQRIARGALPVAEAIEIMLAAMHGVAAVHEAGVIHRDLKPDNIFLCEARPGRPLASKVLDFGISAMTAEADVTLTRDGAVLGTPAYMSPEQLENSRTVDARTDVYAFGVILYEALTGTRPFRAESQHGLVAAIRIGEKTDPRALRADIPRGLAKVVLRALARERDERYPDVKSLITALAPFVGATGYVAESSTRDSATPPRQKALRIGAVFFAVGLVFFSAQHLLPWPKRREPAVERLRVPEAPRMGDAAPADPPSPRGESAEPAAVLGDVLPARAAHEHRRKARTQGRANSPLRPAAEPSAPLSGPDTPASETRSNGARTGKISIEDL